MAILYLDSRNKQREMANFSNFEECADAGYPIMLTRLASDGVASEESYPERCATPDGRTFVREIDDPQTISPPTNMPALPIGPDNPSPGDTIFCTADAMLCPDGTWVGRTGPNCEFVCPGN